MKFWTIQHNKVVDTILKEGTYLPDHNRSRYVETNPELFELYTFMLDAYNDLNKTQEKGLIYGFAEFRDGGIKDFSTLDEFKSFMQSKADVIGTFWQSTTPKLYQVLEIDIPDFYAPICLDYNDFQILMPPINTSSTYANTLLKSLAFGQYNTPMLPSNIVQLHLGSIQKKNLTKIHPLFTL